MSEHSSIEVYDVGLSQYKYIRRTGGIDTPMPLPRVGDYLIVFTCATFGQPSNWVCQHETFEDHVTDLSYALDVAQSLSDTCLMNLINDRHFAAYYFEVWHIVDDMPLTDTEILHLQGPWCAVCGDRCESYYHVRGPLGLFQLCSDCYKAYRTVVTKIASVCEVR